VAPTMAASSASTAMRATKERSTLTSPTGSVFR
jgi:hypothetical protein